MRTRYQFTTETGNLIGGIFEYNNFENAIKDVKKLARSKNCTILIKTLEGIALCKVTPFIDFKIEYL